MQQVTKSYRWFTCLIIHYICYGWCCWCCCWCAVADRFYSFALALWNAYVHSMHVAPFQSTGRCNEPWCIYANVFLFATCYEVDIPAAFRINAISFQTDGYIKFSKHTFQSTNSLATIAWILRICIAGMSFHKP